MSANQRPFLHLIDDDVLYAAEIQQFLEVSGFDVFVSLSARAAFRAFQNYVFDAVILDVGLPDENGFVLCRKIREQFNVSVIFTSARTAEDDRILGLEVGADDYLCKPVSPRELVVRIQAVLRRANKRSETSGSPAIAITLDTSTRTALVGKRTVELTRKEFDILQALQAAAPRILSREHLIDAVWPTGAEISDRTIDSHIKSLRAKIQHEGGHRDIIFSVYGIGYQFRLEQ